MESANQSQRAAKYHSQSVDMAVISCFLANLFSLQLFVLLLNVFVTHLQSFAVEGISSIKHYLKESVFLATSTLAATTGL